jgi:hypothetical protein
MIEFSIIYCKPDIADLVSNEFITPEEAVVTISSANAIEIHQSIFPFWQPCQEFTNGPLNYFTFLDILIQEFEKAKLHIRAFVKHGLLLSGCTDWTHITQKNFQHFVALSFSDVTQTTSAWEDLKIQYDALGKPKGDTVDQDSLIYFCVSKDSLILEMMRTNTTKNFTGVFYDWNSSMLEVLAFIVKRLTIYIPYLKKIIINRRKDIEDMSNLIRSSLFMGNLTSAICFYRKLLHTIDLDTVNDFTTINISNKSSNEEIKDLINHLRTRETIVGIIDK